MNKQPHNHSFLIHLFLHSLISFGLIGISQFSQSIFHSHFFHNSRIVFTACQLSFINFHSFLLFLFHISLHSNDLPTRFFCSWIVVFHSFNLPFMSTSPFILISSSLLPFDPHYLWNHIHFLNPFHFNNGSPTLPISNN